MLAYRHLFHAGNFADVFKHALLTRLLVLLERKDKPLCYLDTHAGIGLYDLSHPWAQKLAEYRDGIERVLARNDAPPLLDPYLKAVHADNPDGRLRRYPGSPRIAQRLLRDTDRIVLTELNVDDCRQLAAVFADDRRVVVEHADGYQALKAHLPPRERRGLILVDSSFDRAREFERLTQAVSMAHRRFATGVFALWYPLMEPTVMRGFTRGFAATGIRKILELELSVFPENWSVTLRGTGMLVVNPPFGFEEEARTVLAWLWQTLSPEGEGTWRVTWLTPE